MPEGLSFFSRSVSPDRLKEKQLCALCASVVKKISGSHSECGKSKTKHETPNTLMIFNPKSKIRNPKSNF